MNIQYSISNIPIVIMAGGEGTRMQKYSRCIPKPLIDYEGKTFIENVIDTFYESGARIFYIILHYKSKLIKSYIESLNLPIQLTFVVEGKKCGTAGGLKLLSGCIQGTFIVCNVDNRGKFDYEKLIQGHVENGADITIPVIKQKVQIPFGVIIERGGKFERIDEKPQELIYISSGIHIMESKILGMIPADQVYDMPDLLNDASKDYIINCIEEEGEKWVDMSVLK